MLDRLDLALRFQRGDEAAHVARHIGDGGGVGHVDELVLEVLSIEYHETIMAAAGTQG